MIQMSPACIPPDLIAFMGTRLFVMYVNLQRNIDGHRLEKTVPFFAVIIMNPWTKKEIHLA